jgi:hypothetical protein
MIALEKKTMKDLRNIGRYWLTLLFCLLLVVSWIPVLHCHGEDSPHPGHDHYGKSSSNIKCRATVLTYCPQVIDDDCHHAYHLHFLVDSQSTIEDSFNGNRPHLNPSPITFLSDESFAPIISIGPSMTFWVYYGNILRSSLPVFSGLSPPRHSPPSSF